MLPPKKDLQITFLWAGVYADILYISGPGLLPGRYLGLNENAKTGIRLKWFIGIL